MINKALYCKNCGYVFNFNDIYIPRLVEKGKCPICRHELYKTPQDAGYFTGRIEKTMPTYEDVVRHKCLKNVIFDEEKAAKRAKKERDKYEQELRSFKNNSNKTESNQFVPKCPTCQSPDIEKISLAKKAVGGALFGLFSSDVRKTMHCKKCGYKW